MAIDLRCPACGRTHLLPDYLAGLVAPCPCGARNPVPRAGSATVAPAARPTPAAPLRPPTAPARADHGTTASPLDGTQMPVDLDTTVPPLEVEGEDAGTDNAMLDLSMPTPHALMSAEAREASDPDDAPSASLYISAGTRSPSAAFPSGEAGIVTDEMTVAPSSLDLASAPVAGPSGVHGIGDLRARVKPTATPIEEAGAQGVGAGAATHFAASTDTLSAESADLVSFLTSKAAVERSRANEYYERGKSLARGGMGEIFLATDRYLKRELVMKLMLPGAQRDAVRVHRFVEEAQVTGQLEHPNIVPVHDLGVTAEGHLYFTMKRVQGDALSKIIDEIKAETPRYVRQYALVARLHLFRSICNALAFAHNRGVIHRDLKPENIMIGEFGEVYVMDWGLAKVQQADGEGAEGASRVTSARAGSSSEVVHTAAGQVFGTPKYMAPEQARGENDRIDHRSDIYSAGAILYELLALRPPIESGSVFEIMIKVGEGDFVAPGEGEGDPDVSVELQAIVMKAMDNDRAGRYQTIGELVEDIDAYLGGRSVSAHQDSPIVVLIKWAKRNKATVAAMAAGLLALVLGVVGMRTFSQAKIAQQAKGMLEQARTDRKAGRLREAQIAGYQALGLAPDDPELKVELSAIGVAIGVYQREQDRVRALDAVRGRLKAEHDAAKAQPAPTSETRRRWYAYWNRALNTARDLARTTDGKDPLALATQCEIARALARQFREDGNYSIAETMIDEAESSGLDPELLKLERFTLAEARTKQLRLDQQLVLEMLAELRTHVPVEDRHQQIVAEMLKRPHPHVVQVLIPKVFSANAAERRLAVEALGQIGDPNTTAPVSVQILPAAEATSRFAAPEIDPDVATDHAEVLREYRARWVDGPAGEGESAQKAVALDALQALSLSLLASPLSYEALEELQRLAWALARMKNERAAEPIAIKRWASGHDSTFWRRTAGAQALVPLPADAPDELRTGELYARRALLRLASGKAAEAKADLDRALAKEPQETRWVHWRALANSALGAADAAKADATKARDSNAAAGRYATTLARILDQAGQRDLALRLLERPTTDVGPAYLLKGQLLQRAHSSAQAMEAFGLAIDADPRLSAAYLGRGQLQLEAAAPQPAALDLERAIELEPELAEAHAELGRALLELGQIDGAFAELDRAEALAVDLWIPHYYRALCYQQAWTLAPTATRGDRRDRNALADRALGSLNRALARRADALDARVMRARMHYERKNWTLSTEDYDRALDYSPDRKDLWYERARTLYYYGDLDRATVDLDKAVAFEPARDDVRLLRARVLRGKYRFDDAIADLDALAAKDPKNTEARFERALVLHRRGQIEGQLAQARLLILQQRAQQGDPTATAAEIEKARLAQEKATTKAKQDLERAIAELTALATEQPRWPLALYYRGEFREENGDSAGRLQDYERAYAVSTPEWFERERVAMFLVQTYADRGVKQANAGNREAGKADLTRALELAKEIGPSGGIPPEFIASLENNIRQLGR